MRRELKAKLKRLDAIPDLIESAIMMAESDGEMIDVIGTIKGVERRYRPYVTGAVKETAPVAVAAGGVTIRGETHAVEVGRKCDRSYNTPRLMTLLQDNGHTIMDLLSMGVLQLTWKWTPLKLFLNREGIEYTIVDHEVSPMGKKEKGEVGEIWTDASPSWT